MMQKKFTLQFIKSLLIVYPAIRDEVELYKATSKYESVALSE